MPEDHVENERKAMKLKCETITFFHYIKIGWDEFWSDQRELPREKSTTEVIRSLLFLLSGLLIIWLFKFFHILLLLEDFILWFLGIGLAISLITFLVFLIISWRKAVRDCWDK